MCRLQAPAGRLRWGPLCRRPRKSVFPVVVADPGGLLAAFRSRGMRLGESGGLGLGLSCYLQPFEDQAPLHPDRAPVGSLETVGGWRRWQLYRRGVRNRHRLGEQKGCEGSSPPRLAECGGFVLFAHQQERATPRPVFFEGAHVSQVALPSDLAMLSGSWGPGVLAGCKHRSVWTGSPQGLGLPSTGHQDM